MRRGGGAGGCASLRGTQALVALPIGLACFALMLQVRSRSDLTHCARTRRLHHRCVAVRLQDEPAAGHASTAATANAVGVVEFEAQESFTLSARITQESRGVVFITDPAPATTMQFSSRGVAPQPVTLPGLADEVGIHRCGCAFVVTVYEVAHGELFGNTLCQGQVPARCPSAPCGQDHAVLGCRTAVSPHSLL